MTKLPQPSLSADQQLATALAKLWPHREHEAPSFSGLFCRMGLHRWRTLDTSQVAPQRHVRFCFWCSVVKIDENAYTP